MTRLAKTFAEVRLVLLSVFHSVLCSILAWLHLLSSCTVKTSADNWELPLVHEWPLQPVPQRLAAYLQMKCVPGISGFKACTCVQGVAAAKNAWKKKNVQAVTKKDEKKARPTGRGDGGLQQQRGGRQRRLPCCQAGLSGSPPFV